MGTLISVCLLATHLLGILDKSFNLCFLIRTARQIIFSIFVGVLDERQRDCKNIVAVVSDLSKSARVPEVLRVVIEERGEARGCCCCLWLRALQPHQEHPQGRWLQSSSCPWLCKEVTVLGNTRDPSAFHREPGIEIRGTTTAPPGAFIHS